MASAAQISANRENSKSSTGPITGEGKSASSKNHLLHGLCAADPVLPTEDRNQFNQLVDQYKSEWLPETTHDNFLVTEMAGARWKLDRIQRMETGMFAALDDPTKAFTDKETAAGFARLERYRAALERTYHRCARALRDLQREKLRNEANAEKAFQEAQVNFAKAAAAGPIPREFAEAMARTTRNYTEWKQSRRHS